VLADSLISSNAGRCRATLASFWMEIAGLEPGFISFTPHLAAPMAELIKEGERFVLPARINQLLRKYGYRRRNEKSMAFASRGLHHPQVIS
jgi:hypothetical protein